jgi:ribonuclease D
VIDTDEKLAQFLPQLRAAAWVALDTEADSLHAYPEKLCLIQISITGADELIDSLANFDLAPLWSVLQTHQLIMHGADYDLRLLRKTQGFVPGKIFDTMLASRLLGEREFGLTNLVANHLGVALEKGSQKADWSKRPLTPRMETYARNDTHFLKQVSDILKQKLEEKSRLNWLEQTCDRLIADCAKPSPPEPDFVWRIKGSHKLSRASLAVLRELWHWREREALAANKPPYFVLSHEALVDIAAAVVESRPIDEFLPRYFSPRRRDSLHEALNAGLGLTDDEQPEYLRSNSRRQTESERTRFDELEKLRNHRATELAIDPTLIASRAMLVLLAADWGLHEPELMRWQGELLK